MRTAQLRPCSDLVRPVTLLTRHTPINAPPDPNGVQRAERRTGFASKRIEQMAARGRPVKPGPQLTQDGEPLRVIVVDDHALFRLAMSESLVARGFVVTAQIALGADALAATIDLQPHVVLMDQRLPDLSGPEATRAILAAAPLTRVVAISASHGESDLCAALAAGSVGYLLKTAAPDELAAGVRAAAAGHSPISPEVASHLLSSFLRTATSTTFTPESVLLAAQLSSRERDVLGLLTTGCDNKSIADTLFISPHTVKGHVSTILTKLRVANRIQAAVYAARHGLG